MSQCNSCYQPISRIILWVHCHFLEISGNGILQNFIFGKNVAMCLLRKKENRNFRQLQQETDVRHRGWRETSWCWTGANVTLRENASLTDGPWLKLYPTKKGIPHLLLSYMWLFLFIEGGGERGRPKTSTRTFLNDQFSLGISLFSAFFPLLCSGEHAEAESLQCKWGA